MRKVVTLLSTLAFAATAGVAAAQTKAPAKPRGEASLACSKQADEQGLKGKARKKFRAKCKREYKAT